MYLMKGTKNKYMFIFWMPLEWLQLLMNFIRWNIEECHKKVQAMKLFAGPLEHAVLRGDAGLPDDTQREHHLHAILPPELPDGSAAHLSAPVLRQKWRPIIQVNLLLSFVMNVILSANA